MTTSRLSLLVLLALTGGTLGAGTARADPKDDRVLWGIGGEVRRSYVSVGIQKLFIGDSPGPAKQDGVGVVFTHRAKQIEVMLELGYDPIRPTQGFYLEKGKDPTSTNAVDFYEFDDKLSWFTAAVKAVGRIPIHKILGIRYGAGLGIGVIRGHAYRTSAVCTSIRLQDDCATDPNGARQHEPLDVPVLPVLDLLAGIELRPIRRVALHLDVGLHTAPYVAAGVTLYLW